MSESDALFIILSLLSLICLCLSVCLSLHDIFHCGLISSAFIKVPLPTKPWTAHDVNEEPTVRRWVENNMSGLPGSRMQWVCDATAVDDTSSEVDERAKVVEEQDCGGRVRYPIAGCDMKTSIFGRRRQECDSRADLDTGRIWGKALQVGTRI